MAIPLTKDLTNTITNSGFKQCSNFNLLFNKFISNWNTADFEYNAQKVGDFLQSILNIRTVNEYTIFFNRWKKNITAINNVKTFEMQTASRLAIGLGNETVLENSMTLHHIYGVPYIPGSALKGIFRAFFIEECLLKALPPTFKADKQIIDLLIETTEEKNCLKTDEKNAKKIEYKIKVKEQGQEHEKRIKITDELVNYNDDVWLARLDLARRVFGTQNNQGGLIFYDALPLQFPALKVEIINNHFDKYYKGDKKAPGDWEQELNINKFLTVEKNQKFLFALGKRSGLPKYLDISDDISNENNEFEICELELKRCLKDKGVGAKTAVGYGYFKEIKR